MADELIIGVKIDSSKAEAGAKSIVTQLDKIRAAAEANGRKMGDSISKGMKKGVAGVSQAKKSIEAVWKQHESAKTAITRQENQIRKAFDKRESAQMKLRATQENAMWKAAEAARTQTQKAQAAIRVAAAKQESKRKINALKKLFTDHRANEKAITKAHATELKKREAKHRAWMKNIVAMNKKMTFQGITSQKISARPKAAATPDIFGMAGVKNPKQVAAEMRNIAAAQKHLTAEIKKGNITGKTATIMTRNLTKKMNLLTIGTSNARSGFRRLTARLASFSFELTGAIYGITAMGAILGAPAIIGTKFLSTIEDTKIGMVGILMSMGQVEGKAVSYAQAIGAASKMTDELTKASMRFAVPMEALTTTLQATLAPGMAAGMSLEEIQKVATVGTVAVKAIGLDSRQVVQEIRDLVAGGIQAASSTLATSLGLTDADIKAAKKSTEGLYTFLMSRLEAFAIAAKERQKTLSGAFELLKQKMVLLFADVTIFETIKESIIGISNAIATIKGDKLVFSEEAQNAAEVYLGTVNIVIGALGLLTTGIIKFSGAIATLIEGFMFFWAGSIFKNAMSNLFDLFSFGGTGSKSPLRHARKVVGKSKSLMMGFVAFTRKISASAAGGLLGLALFALYEAADYFGLMDGVFDSFEKRMAKTRKGIEDANKKDMMKKIKLQSQVVAGLAEEMQPALERHKNLMSLMGKKAPKSSFLEDQEEEFKEAVAVLKEYGFRIDELIAQEAKITGKKGEAGRKAIWQLAEKHNISLAVAKKRMNELASATMNFQAAIVDLNQKIPLQEEHVKTLQTSWDDLFFTGDQEQFTEVDKALSAAKEKLISLIKERDDFLIMGPELFTLLNGVKGSLEPIKEDTFLTKMQGEILDVTNSLRELQGLAPTELTAVDKFKLLPKEDQTEAGLSSAITLDILKEHLTTNERLKSIEEIRADISKTTAQTVLGLEREAIDIRNANLNLSERELQNIELKRRESDMLANLQEDVAGKLKELAADDADGIAALGKAYGVAANEIVAAIKKIQAAQDANTNAMQTWQDGAKAAWKDYSDAVETTAEASQQTFSKLFKGMEDAIVEFAMTGKISFSDFARSVIADLAQIAAKRATANLADLLFSAFLPSTAGSPNFGGGSLGTDVGAGASAFNTFSMNAKGNIFSGRGISDYSNTIVDKPTLFANGGNLMGEAGPEGILPLTRMGSGNLGVEASNTGGDIINSISVEVNVNSDGSSDTTVTGVDEGKALGNLIGVAVKQELLKESRPGGMLNRR